MGAYRHKRISGSAEIYLGKLTVLKVLNEIVIVVPVFSVYLFNLFTETFVKMSLRQGSSILGESFG